MRGQPRGNVDQLRVLRAHEHVHAVVRLGEGLVEAVHVADRHGEHALHNEVGETIQIGEGEEEIGECGVLGVLREAQLVLIAEVKRSNYTIRTGKKAHVDNPAAHESRRSSPRIGILQSCRRNGICFVERPTLTRSSPTRSERATTPHFCIYERLLASR